MSFDRAAEGGTAFTADAGCIRVFHSPAYAADRARA